MIRQRLEIRDGIWTCPGCGARLICGDFHGGDGGSLEHRDDCSEVGAMAKRWNWPPADEPEYRTCCCGPDGQPHWHTLPPRPA